MIDGLTMMDLRYMQYCFYLSQRHPLIILFLINFADGFGIFGVVKEVVPPESVIDLKTDYFNYPLYKDEAQAFYKALGSRKLKITSWNPIKIYRGIRDMNKRLSTKGISGNMKGEGLVQGGVIIFDASGTARFAYREETGSEIPVEDIIAVVRELRKESKESQSS